jgi:hypothetical protein
VLILETLCGYSLKPEHKLILSSEERLLKQIEEQLKKLKK